ncbi:RsiG family protein [Yinghuangia sp. YIM S09857]|uniref:RsiG family protein n=1 Tax=Yinghuangia sp. YIM S09857 TaxID=3436929 RepID=UPI003F53004C
MADPLKPSARDEAAQKAAPPAPSAAPAEGPFAVPDPVRALGLDAVRSRRREAQREESDLSYLRRLLQGRIDILRAELLRREDPAAAPAGPGPAPVMEKLSEILSERRGPARGARHVTVHPPRTERYRVRIERMLADVELSDLAARSDAELRAALEDLTGYEQEVSARRLELQREMDRCGAEIARRYREGEARVDDLLSGR